MTVPCRCESISGWFALAIFFAEVGELTTYQGRTGRTKASRLTYSKIEDHSDRMRPRDYCLHAVPVSSAVHVGIHYPPAIYPNVGVQTSMHNGQFALVVKDIHTRTERCYSKLFRYQRFRVVGLGLAASHSSAPRVMTHSGL